MPLSPQALVVESQRQLHLAWTYFAHQLPGGERADLPGLLIANGRSPLPFMNAAFLTSMVTDESDLRERLEHASAYFGERALHWVLIASDDFVPEALAPRLGDLCAAVGLQYMMPMMGMVTDTLRAPVRPPAALEMRPVDDAATREAVGDINGAGYGIPCETMRAATCIPDLWESMLGVVGYRDGQPVSTASVVACDGTSYVCLVATVPEHQGRGYGEAVMREALDAAAARWGFTRTVLHATPAGRPVYTRMGYADTGNFQVYVPADH
jgi:ribosomal protein S18 acetylase RimI-like enzyme